MFLLVIYSSGESVFKLVQVCRCWAQVRFKAGAEEDILSVFTFIFHFCLSNSRDIPISPGSQLPDITKPSEPK